MVVVLVAAEERQIGAAAPLALVGYHQAEHLGVEALHRVPVFDIDAHMGEPRMDGHGRSPSAVLLVFKARRAGWRKSRVPAGRSGWHVAAEFAEFADFADFAAAGQGTLFLVSYRIELQT